VDSCKNILALIISGKKAGRGVKITRTTATWQNCALSETCSTVIAQTGRCCRVMIRLQQSINTDYLPQECNFQGEALAKINIKIIIKAGIKGNHIMYLI